MKYRPEIDGLRALAVLPVILFHAGIELFSGGYVGVDIFFVISGYLITTIIYKELVNGTFSIAQFYERRARRLLPALFFIMAICFPFAWAWLSPEDLTLFGKGIISVVTFSANFFFAFNFDYFSTAGELNPLLHTWSLAVEEQFYLFYPLLLLVLYGRGVRKIVVVLTFLAFASLSLAQWGIFHYPTETFFLLPTRAWELLAGALCAFILLVKSDNQVNRYSHGFSLLGVLLILWAVFFFDESTPIPSFYGLVPVAGTVLVILFAQKHNFVGRLLSTKLMVGIGLISYSAYLWHQPVLAFARYRLTDPVFEQFLPSLLFSVLVLAYLSWRYIEQPFRRGSGLRNSRSKVFTVSGSAMVCLVSIGMLVVAFKGLPYRYTDKIAHILSYQDYPHEIRYRTGKCFLMPMQQYHHFSSECEVANSGLVWGDSHAAAIYAGLNTHVAVSKYTASLCPPLINFDAPRRVYCRNINNYVLDIIAEKKHPFIFLHANWNYYDRDAVIMGLKETVSSVYDRSPDSKIVVIGSVVNWGQKGLPSVLADHVVRASGAAGNHARIPVDTTDAIKIDRLIDSSLAAFSNVLFLSTIELLCDEGACLAGVNDENHITPLAWDYGHLTRVGAEFLAARLFENPQLQSLNN